MRLPDSDSNRDVLSHIMTVHATPRPPAPAISWKSSAC